MQMSAGAWHGYMPLYDSREYIEALVSHAWLQLTVGDHDQDQASDS
jgi:hypothetical protein